MLGVAPLCPARSSYAASRPRGARCRSRSLASRPVSGVGFAVGLPVWFPHALGHLLLDTAGHADEGIMRWGWAAADLGCHDVADRRCRFSGCECTMGGSPATRARAVHRAARMAEARSSLRPLPTARRRWYPVVRSDSGWGGRVTRGGYVALLERVGPRWRTVLRYGDGRRVVVDGAALVGPELPHAATRGGGCADEVGGHTRARGHAVAGSRRTGFGLIPRHEEGVAAFAGGVRAHEVVSAAHGRGGQVRPGSGRRSR
jgi:hypothetical protein